MSILNIRAQLYEVGVNLARKFLDVNRLPHPEFYTYDEVSKLMGGTRVGKLVERFRNMPLIGGMTGYYHQGMVLVNVPVTCLPVDRPAYRSWSYPCWKTDRTAVGVVAHEVGHHIERVLQQSGVLTPETHGPEWRRVMKGKRVSGYEPVPSEAWAETLRLFILNPYLLKFAIPRRYKFVRQFLKPSEQRTWRAVLLDHPAYCEQGNKWIRQ